MKSGRGGKRAGSGRPATGKKERITIQPTKENLEWLRSQRESNSFILNRLMNAAKNNTVLAKRDEPPSTDCEVHTANNKLTTREKEDTAWVKFDEPPPSDCNVAIIDSERHGVSTGWYSYSENKWFFHDHKSMVGGYFVNDVTRWKRFQKET